MANAIEVEEFIQKWEPSILYALEGIREALLRAGYFVTFPDGDLDLPDQLRWSMLVNYPGRPDTLESMDLFVCFTIEQAAESPVTLLPYIEIYNFEGSFLETINISDLITPDDVLGFQKAVDTARDKAGDVVRLLEEYFPKPTKRRWKIHVTAPGNVKRHASLHTNEEIAKGDVSVRLTGMLDQIQRLFWEAGILRMYSGWDSSSSYYIGQVRTLLDKGDVWAALRKYDDFLDAMNPSMLNRVAKTVGSLNVERLGGYPDEEDD